MGLHFDFDTYKLIFSIIIISLGEERAGLYASHAFVCLSCMNYPFSFSLPLGVGGLAADCDCGTPWIFYSAFWYVDQSLIKPKTVLSLLALLAFGQSCVHQ